MLDLNYYCPVNAWDCPYFNKNGTCRLGVAAPQECDDAAIYEWLEDDDFPDEEQKPKGGN